MVYQKILIVLKITTKYALRATNRFFPGSALQNFESIDCGIHCGQMPNSSLMKFDNSNEKVVFY